MFSPDTPDNKIIDFASFSAAPDLPPQNIEIEAALLGGLLHDGQAIEQISEILTPDAFYLNAHACVYRGCLALHAASKPIDLMTITTWLTDQKLLDKLGGQAFLAQLLGQGVNTANLDAYAHLLVDKYTRRCLLKGASQIEKLAHDGGKTVEQVTDQAEQIVYAIAQSSRGSDLDQCESIADISPRLWQLLEQGKTSGIQTGFLDLDAMTGGFYPGTLTIAAARTAIGKTQLAIALTHEIASLGLPVVFFSCEMSKEEIANRLLARISLIDSARLREGRVQPEEWKHLANAISMLGKLPIHIHSVPHPKSSDMRSVIRRVSSQHGGKLGLVILDYIQLLGDSTDNRVSELDKIVRDFRALAKEFNVPCFGLAQINRGVENRKDKRPLLSDIRESGSLEAHADVVWLLYRDDYYDPNSVDKGIIEISVAKNRHGQSGTVRMLFSPQYSLFRSLARGGRS